MDRIPRNCHFSLLKFGCNRTTTQNDWHQCAGYVRKFGWHCPMKQDVVFGFVADPGMSSQRDSTGLVGMMFLTRCFTLLSCFSQLSLKILLK